MAGAAGFITGVALGNRVTLERAVRLSTVIQLLIYGFSTIAMALVAPPHWGLVAGLAIVSPYLLNIAAVLRAHMSRRPYPWVLLRWTFTVAAVLAFTVHAYRVSHYGVSLARMMPATLLYTLPVWLQALVLWVRGAPADPPHEHEPLEMTEF